MDLETIQIAALLHDIGKFYQRTKQSHDESYKKYVQSDFGQTGAHGKWSADFVKEIWGDDVEDLVLYHHNPKKSNYPEMANIITKADHHSSNERITSDETQKVLEEPLISIFSRIKLGNEEPKKYFVPLKKLSLNSTSFNELKPNISKKGAREGWNLKPEYIKLWKQFTTEIKTVKNPNNFDTILALMKKYTSTIPSAIYVSEPDISLFDHSKTTAALATCRYLFIKDSAKKIYTSKPAADEQKVYLAFSGDISGIQKFIYRLSSPKEAQSGMSKRLRGRSLYLTLLSDAIVSRIIEDLGLTQANILFCGGGRFNIIAPNTEITLAKLEKIKRDVNNLFIKKFNAEIYLATASIPCSGNDLENFGKLTEKLNHKISDDKKHKFIDDLEKVFEIETSVGYDNTCSVCGNKTNDEICDECESHGEIGRKVANADNMIKCYSESNNKKFDFYEEPLKVGYIFKKKNNNLLKYINNLSKEYASVEVIKLNNSDFLDLATNIENKNISLSFSYLGNIVPQHPKTTLYFEHLAKISEGANKLGILKMDVDNLGTIFSKGFDFLKDKEGNSKGATISRISTLSSFLDMFFSGFINEIAKEYKVFEKCCDECKGKLKEVKLEIQKNENDFDSEAEFITVYKEKNEKVCSECEDKYTIPTIHINYSGGDDLLVLGPYDDIIEFAKVFRDKFKQWTCENPDITLSGGINIVGPKFPIGKAADLAEKYLKASKNCGSDKDKITLFADVVKWEDWGSAKGFNELLEFGQELENHIMNDDLSKGIVYSMLRMWQDTFSNSNKLIDNKEDWKEDVILRLKKREYVPLFKYKLRLVKNRNVRENLDKKGLKFMPWIKIPVSWVSLRMR